MALSVCRRVYVDLDAVKGASLTVWQPGLNLASSRESVIQTGLTTLNLMPSVLSTVPSVPVYVRCSTSGVSITNGATNTAATPAGSDASPSAPTGYGTGWLLFADFDPNQPIIVTPNE